MNPLEVIILWMILFQAISLMSYETYEQLL